MNPDRTSANPPPVADPPPILGSWQRMYWLVLGTCGVVVLLLYWLTKIYQ